MIHQDFVRRKTHLLEMAKVQKGGQLGYMANIKTYHLREAFIITIKRYFSKIGRKMIKLECYSIQKKNN